MHRPGAFLTRNGRRRPRPLPLIGTWKIGPDRAEQLVLLGSAFTAAVTHVDRPNPDLPREGADHRDLAHHDAGASHEINRPTHVKIAQKIDPHPGARAVDPGQILEVE